jgi:hypothetical protein
MRQLCCYSLLCCLWGWKSLCASPHAAYVGIVVGVSWFSMVSVHVYLWCLSMC